MRSRLVAGAERTWRPLAAILSRPPPPPPVVEGKKKRGEVGVCGGGV